MTPTDAGQVRLLSRSDIRALLRWPELISATRNALIKLTVGDGASALSGHLTVPGAALHLKSGALLDPPILSVKANLRPAAGSSTGVVLAFDPVGFTLRAVLDSADITAMRTAAVAAVAAAELAPDALTTAVIGAGPVGRQTLEALRHVRPTGPVRLWSRDQARAEQLAATVDSPVTVCASAAEAASGAGLIITATPAREPVLPAGSVAPGAIVLALGADTVGKRELHEGVLHEAAVVVDAVEAFAVGECAYLPGGHDSTMLGLLLAGQASLPADRRHVVFDSVGSAVVDAAATELVLTLAKRADAGQLFSFAG